MICGISVTGGALTAHPIDIVLYSGIIKRILQTVEVCGILFCYKVL